MRSLGRVVPAPLAARLSGPDPASQEGFTVSLVTLDAEGWPHLALLSAGEVLVVGDEIRLALWPGSDTMADLARDGRGVLHAVDDGAAWLVRIVATPAGELRAPGMHLAAYRCRVEEAFEDRVGYATLEDGIRFSLNERDRQVPRWRRTIDALRDLDGGASG